MVKSDCHSGTSEPAITTFLVNCRIINLAACALYLTEAAALSRNQGRKETLETPCFLLEVPDADMRHQ